MLDSSEAYKVLGALMRNMSFALTTQQFKDGTKDVTRRFGWNFLKPGHLVCAVEKGMGLKKGEKIIRLGVIEIVDVRQELLGCITQEECIREGFPHFTPKQFIVFLTGDYYLGRLRAVNRIEFKKIEAEYDTPF